MRGEDEEAVLQVAPAVQECPVVCKRLMNQGLAEKLDSRHYVLSLELRKKQYKAARA